MKIRTKDLQILSVRFGRSGYRGSEFAFPGNQIENAASLANDAQWRIQEFQDRGRGHGAVGFFESRDCFDVPSHMPSVLVVKVENEMHILNTAC